MNSSKPEDPTGKLKAGDPRETGRGAPQGRRAGAAAWGTPASSGCGHSDPQPSVPGMRPEWGFLSSQTQSSGLSCLSGKILKAWASSCPWEKGIGHGGSFGTVMAFKVRPTQRRRQTRRQGREKPRPTQAVGREEAESSPERHFQHPRGQASQSSGMEATLSQEWARLGPRPLNGQDWGKAKRRQESERKLKSRQGHVCRTPTMCWAGCLAPGG